MKNSDPRPFIYCLLVLVCILFTLSSCGKDDTCTEKTWYQNNDGDSEGNNNVTLLSCDKPDGYIDVGGDPDDTNANITSDCEQVTYYADEDEDNYGDPNNSITQCSGVDAPTGYVMDNTDCNDDSSQITNLGATVYADVDGDGFGDPGFPKTVETCGDYDGNVLDNTDCDDTNADNYPGSQYMVYQDSDNDGLGNPEVSQTVAGCTTVPEGYVLDNTDCNDQVGPFIAEDWVGTYYTDRTSYGTNGTTSQLGSGFGCTIETVEGQSNSLKLIGFWDKDYIEDEIILEVDPCTQKATWYQEVPVGYNPFDPYTGDITWIRDDFGGFSSNEIELDPEDNHGWCVFDFENKIIKLYGVSYIPDHEIYFAHYLCEYSKL
ncbi:hypothetical protein [Flagellimonas sp.]|uniref:hypothetical protein n=1 Tax=Flagellimonas sp. TaxID=2058762 RepID=UPI003BAE4443